MDNHEQYRYGSAQWATVHELRRAKIIGGNKGMFFGFDQTGAHELRVPSDGSIAVFGGAGCGKSAGFFAQNLLGHYEDCNAVLFDARGELTAGSTLCDSLHGYEEYCINPAGIPWANQHKTEPFDHLSIDSPSLIADNRKTIMTIQNRYERWWEADALDWACQLNLAIVERDGVASLQRLYEAIRNIQGNIEQWCVLLDFMQRSRFPDVQRFAGQIMKAQENGRDSFSAPMGEIYTSFAFMQDPRISEAFSGADFSMGDVCQDDKKIKIKILVPIEYIKLWAPVIRLLIGSSILQKLRKPGGKRVGFFIDECGQLGHFDLVRELYTFCRGANMFAACAWQEIAQLQNAFGHEGAKEIMGSAQIQVFKGVRTLETARLVSQMCGMSTLEYNSALDQSQARKLKREAARAMLSGGNFMELREEIRYQSQAATHRKKQPRQLITEAEVLNMSSNQMIAFASGLDVGPILGTWKMYFEQKKFAGKYLNNPYHNTTHVSIAGTFGKKKARVIESPVPSTYAHLPQYAGGTWRTVEGYKPRRINV